MQFLPSSAADYNSLVSTAGQILSATVSQHGGPSFETVFSSFIEEGRSDYSGRPAGFAALEEASGTIDSEKASLLKDALKKRNVQDASLQALEDLMASGAPVTVGKVFGVLSGASRVSGALEGKDRDSFQMLMSKLGFSKEESDELVDLTDAGKISAAWRRIAKKLEGLGGEGVDVHSDEFSALLKGLDISGPARARMEKAFGAGGLTLTREQLNALLAEAGRELAAKDLAAGAARAQMRDAMNEAMQAAKIKEKADAVADKRGARHLDQSEAVMQDTVFKKAAKGGNLADREKEREFDDANDGRSRAERILSKVADKAETRSETKAQKADAGDALSRMMHRIDTAGAQSAPDSTAPGQNLRQTAQAFRQEIFSQVEKGILQNAQNGSRQITLQLDPKDLGQLTLVLSVREGEVKALIRAENAESATALREQMAELKANLESQGMKVSALEVETQVRQDLNGQWDGAGEHNLMRDANERARMLRLNGLRKEAGESNGPASAHISAPRQETGLHIVA